MSTALQILQQWRERLSKLQGEDYWRALAAASGDVSLQRAACEVVPELASLWERRIDRRRLLQWLGASLAFAAAAGCSRSGGEKLVPYTVMPEGIVPGVPQLWATTLTRSGYGHGVLVKTHMGRPIKVDGNPLHPASVGATDVFAQAAALELFDPQRSRAATLGGGIVASSAVLEAFAQARRRWLAKHGGGLAILTGAVASPTLRRQLTALRGALPEARWYQHEPVTREAALLGSTLAYGRAADAVFDFTRARIVVALDADFLDALPGHLRYARQFAGARRALTPREGVNRLYAAASMPTLVGARADHRLLLPPLAIEPLTRRLAALLGAMNSTVSRLDSAAERWLTLVAKDLLALRGESLVLCGDHQPAGVHALVHAINHQLGNVGRTLQLIDPVVDFSASQGGLPELCDALASGAIESLLMLESNPVYTAPADLPVQKLLQQARFSLHTGLYVDETAVASQWHVPAPHAFEAWGDARAFDGTASLVQPLIEPLYPSRSAHEWLALAQSGEAGTAYEQVRATWQSHAAERGDEFAALWHESLASGVIARTAAATRVLELRADWQRALPPPAATTGLQLRLAPDHSVWDGRYANSAWLQELPRPLSSLTWGNALLISPGLARELGVSQGDHVSIEQNAHTLVAPVWPMPEQPEGSVTLALGYGRTHAGSIGTDVGVNAYRLRTQSTPWIASGLRVRAVGGHTALASVQQHHDMHGRQLARTLTLDDFMRGASAREADRLPQPPRSLYGDPQRHGRYAWGMTIDLNACIGCGVCTIACQAENNIPAVGKEQVLAGREMHWIRVDSYHTSAEAGSLFQPVPCMHCELAPCEYVCPVEASIHDSEGLNLQVYNRCIGTRDCSQNCPYKVRRFNWLDYNGYEHATPLAAPPAVMNPDVTVRSRGVMEKCTYCVQRISRARIESKVEDREIREGEVMPACAAACPAQAIVFGDLQKADSEVNRWRASQRHYVLLAELGTRPRTTYLAALANPHPDADNEEGGA